MDLAFIPQKKTSSSSGIPAWAKASWPNASPMPPPRPGGVEALFTTAMDMINHLAAAEADRSLLKNSIFYQAPEVLVIDYVSVHLC